MKYRKKPVVIEAFQYHPETFATWPQWAVARLRHIIDEGLAVSRDGSSNRDITSHGSHLVITTLEGDHRANDGDWIIKGVKDEVYACKPDIFAATYEPAE